LKITGFNDDFGDLTTLISVPKRSPFGNPSYRGNYDGEVLAKLVGFLQRNGIQSPYVYDPMEGGKTSRDVCSHLALPYIGDDIHNGFDVVNDDFHDTGFDLTMLHYPYWSMIDYAKDLAPELQGKDMSRMDWRTFIEAVSHVNYKAAAHSRYVAVLVGDMVVKGKGFIKSIQREMAWVGNPIRFFTKLQHNATSFRTKYSNTNFIPIVTEHLILFKTDYKPGGELWILVPGQYKKIHVDHYVTWKTAIKNLSKSMEQITPESVFEGIKQHFPVKLQKTNTPEATIRRTLQELESDGFLQRAVRGIYVKRAS
jgi:hypothetical protein